MPKGVAQIFRCDNCLNIVTMGMVRVSGGCPRCHSVKLRNAQATRWERIKLQCRFIPGAEWPHKSKAEKLWDALGIARLKKCSY